MDELIRAINDELQLNADYLTTFRMEWNEEGLDLQQQQMLSNNIISYMNGLRFALFKATEGV